MIDTCNTTSISMRFSRLAAIVAGSTLLCLTLGACGSSSESSGIDWNHINYAEIACANGGPCK